MTYSSVVLATSGLQSYWRLDEPSGTSFTDLGVGAHGGTYTVTETLNQPGLIPNDNDTCVRFTGGYGEAGANYGMAVKATFSIEMWAMNTIVSSDAVNRRMVGVESASLTGWYLFWLASTTTITFGRTSASITYAAAALNKPFHIVGTYDATSLRLYVNGALVAGPTASSASLATQTTNFRIGCQAYNASNPFNGFIDEVAVYNVALPAATVAAHYAAGLPLIPGQLHRRPPIINARVASGRF